MVADPCACGLVSGMVLGFSTSPINSFTPHNGIRKFRHTYRSGIQGTKRPRDVPESHVAHKHQIRGVNSGSLAPEFTLLTRNSTCAEHQKLVSESGHPVKRNLGLFVSTTTVKDAFALFREKLSCKNNWERVALANGTSTGWEVRRHRIQNLYKMRAEQHASLFLFRPVLVLALCFLMASSHNRYLKSHELQMELWNQIRERERDCPDAKKEIIGC